MGTIAIFASSRREADDPLYAQAYEMGRLLAHAGHAVLTGGYGGSMGAISRGAREAGGHVVGVTCAIFDPLTGNPWLTEEVKTASMLDRLQTLMTRADAYVALRGGIGTLSEVTLAWSLVQTRSISKPLVLVGPHWRRVVDAFLKHTDLGPSIAALATMVDTPAEVLPALVAPPTPLGPPPLG